MASPIGSTGTFALVGIVPIEEHSTAIVAEAPVHLASSHIVRQSKIKAEGSMTSSGRAASKFLVCMIHMVPKHREAASAKSPPELSGGQRLSSAVVIFFSVVKIEREMEIPVLRDVIATGGTLAFVAVGRIRTGVEHQITLVAEAPVALPTIAFDELLGIGPLRKQSIAHTG
jgi:hypothetical protein